MSELTLLLRFLPNSKSDSDTDTTDENKKVAITSKEILKVIYILIFAAIQIILWAWAVNVAVEISSPTPDSRLMHVMFALMSPSLYLFYAYTQKGVWIDPKPSAPLCTPVGKSRKKRS